MPKATTVSSSMNRIFVDNTGYFDWQQVKFVSSDKLLRRIFETNQFLSKELPEQHLRSKLICNCHSFRYFPIIDFKFN